MPYKNPSVRRSYNIVYQRVYYRLHKPTFIEKNRARKRAARDYLESVKRKRSCVVCGESDFRCLDFHHLNGRDKWAGLSELATDGAAIERLNRELAKCTVLCRSCHAKEHFKR